MSPSDSPRKLRLRSLNRAAPLQISYVPDADVMSDLADRLELLGLRKVRVTGQLHPEGRRDWHLVAQIGGTATQPCSVTLAPVTTRIDDEIERRFLEDYSDPDDAEAESPDDDTQEPLPEWLDLADLASEVLALALPDFPRAPDAEIAQTEFSPPGATPIEETRTNPFQALAALKSEPGDDNGI